MEPFTVPTRHPALNVLGRTALLLLAALAACESIPDRTQVAVINLSDEPVEYTLGEDGGTLRTGGYQVHLVSGGEHTLTVSRDGEEIDRHVFSSDPDRDYVLVYNVEAAGSFAVIEVEGAYEGGGIFTLGADTDFPIAATAFREKFFRVDIPRPSLFVMPMRPLPESVMAAVRVYQLCPILDSWEGDGDEIRRQCLAMIARANT